MGLPAVGLISTRIRLQKEVLQNRRPRVRSLLPLPIFHEKPHRFGEVFRLYCTKYILSLTRLWPVYECLTHLKLNNKVHNKVHKNPYITGLTRRTHLCYSVSDEIKRMFELGGVIMADQVRRPKGTGTILELPDGRVRAKLTVDGKTKTKICITRTEANRTLNKWIRENKESNGINVQKKSLSSSIKIWLQQVKRNELKPTSYDRLESIIELYIIPELGMKQFGVVEGTDIQALLNKIDKSGKSYSTIKKVYDALHGFYDWAIDMRQISYNPTRGVIIPQSQRSGIKKRKKGTARFYTQKEQDSLVAAAIACYPNGTPIYRFGYIVPFLLNTGLRLGELLELQWDRDVDLEKRMIRVENSLVVVKNRDNSSEKKTMKVLQDSTKSEAGERTIYLNDEALDALQHLQKLTGRFSHVIATRNGETVQPSNIDRMMRTVCERAGLKDRSFGPHALRHSFATNLISGGVDIKVVSELLGHSDISVTYNTYIHVINEQKKDALIKIGERKVEKKKNTPSQK